MAFELPPLPYAYDALTPSIDEETMHLHHDKHHAAYVNNLNTATEGTPFTNMSIYELVRNLNMVPDDKMIVDIGPQTVQAFEEVLNNAKTVFWNGPMGVFETPSFGRSCAPAAVGRPRVRSPRRSTTPLVGSMH